MGLSGTAKAVPPGTIFREIIRGWVRGLRYQPIG